MKKSILFIADKPNWAYHNIIKIWAESLTEYDCYVAFTDDYMIRAGNFTFFDVIKSKLCQLKSDHSYFKISPSRKYSYPVYKENPVYNVISGEKKNITHFDFLVEMAYYFQYISEIPFKADKKIVGLYTDSFPHEGPNMDNKNNIDTRKLSREEFFNKYIKPYDALLVGSGNLYNDYHKFNFPMALANGIYRAEDFEENLNVGQNENLTIGWTGNPNREMKGFREIIEPAIKELQEEGLNLNLKTKFSGSYEELLSFYKDVDLVVIASSADTGPALFSEAALSSVPAISTKIGFPNTIIKDRENGLFIDRDKEQLKSAIRILYNDRQLLYKFSKNIKQDYLNLFDNKIFINNLRHLLNTI